MSTDGTRKLRVGLLVNATRVPAWVHSIVEHIQLGHYAAVVMVAQYVPPAELHTPFHKRLWANRHQLLYLGYSALDDRLFRDPIDAWEQRDLVQLVGEVPWLQVTPIQSKFSDRFPQATITELKRLDLDVILRFGFRILRGDILKVPRYGVWSFHHGDNRVNRGGPPGFWEVMLGEHVTGSVLQILTERLDDGEVLYRSWSATEPRSVRRNRNNFYWRSSTSMPRQLEQLYEEGESAIDVDEASWEPYCRRLYVKPRNSEMMRGLARLGSRYVLDKLKTAVSLEQWALRFHFKKGGISPHRNLYRYKKITPPRDRYWADPFPVFHEGEYYVFFEEVPYSTNRGHIAVARLTRRGFAESPAIALKTDYHLSYPFLIRQGGELFMIPETRERGTVELWRCTRFPNEWVLERVLMESVLAVDATIYEADDRLWMFMNMQSVPGGNAMDELFLFHSESLEGKWKAHRRNPIVSDVRCARPAGGLFRSGGLLLRPGQDCSRHYGGGIAINSVERLTTNEYRERELSRIEPAWERGLIGVHTLNHVGDLSVADVLLQRPRFGR